MTSTIKPTFSGEVMLAGWKESHTSGATVTFWLSDSADLDIFRGMTAKKGNVAGQRFAAVLVEIHDGEVMETVQNPAPTRQEVHRPNQLAQYLHSHGYFYDRRLWSDLEASGIWTEEDHVAYIRSLKCLGARDWVNPYSARVPSPEMGRALMAIECGGDVVGHHTPSATLPAAGGGRNPRKVEWWYQVPLCHNHHQMWAHGSSSKSALRANKVDLVVAATHIMAAKVKELMKDYLAIESLADLTEKQLYNWESNVRQTGPEEFSKLLAQVGGRD